MEGLGLGWLRVLGFSVSGLGLLHRGLRLSG